MRPSQVKRDLVVLAADRDIEAGVGALLNRSTALGLRPIEATFYTHPRHDAGCCREGADFLRPLSQMFSYALVMFDREGCGRERQSREALEYEVETRLSQSGWAGRVAAVVFEPELESWVWSDSRQVDSILGWQGSTPPLREWLRAGGYLAADAVKPGRPKEALLAALRGKRIPFSAHLFRQLGERVSVQHCSDPAFAKLRVTLSQWFGES